MSNKPSKLYRLLKIVNLLQSGIAFSPAELAERLEVSVRTVFRDLNQLELAHVPVYYDEGKNGYQILKTFFLSPVNLDTEEALALLTLGEGVKLASFQEAAHSALLKVRNVLPNGIRDSVMDVAPKIAIRPSSLGVDSSRNTYRFLCEAIRQSRVVAGRYYSLKDRKEMQVRIRPYSLFFARHSWYVIGYVEKLKKERTFKLARFHSLSLTEATFVPPENFSLDDVMGNAWGIIRGEREERVVARFEKDAVPYVRETFWHPTQQIRDLPDGKCEFEVTVSGLDEIKWWLLGWGPMVEVLQPKTLREQMIAAFRGTAQRYQEHT